MVRREKEAVLYGQELADAIKELGLNKNSFAEKCVLPDGSTLSAQAIGNLINSKKISPKSHTIAAVENALRKKCRCCKQYTENPDAWEKPKR